MDASQTPASPATSHPFVQKLRMHREYFHRTLECFRDGDASFRVTQESMTAAGQAHHRGALSQYARGLGLEPKIPYFDMAEALHEAMLLSDQEAKAGAPVVASP